MKFNTLAVHAGVEPDPSTGAIMTPIFQTSTYVQDAPGEHKGYEYARTQNPTRQALQESIAALEGGKHGLAFSSGMAAMDAIVKLLKQGDEVIASSDLYGGSFRLLRSIYEKFGIKSHFVDMSDMRKVEAAINERTKLLWIETPTNPMLQLVDIPAITKLAKSRGVISTVDNTFATPYLQQPLELGADLVHHSATKYIGGHSDVVLGVVVTNNDVLAEDLAFMQNSVGAVPGPQDCFLTLRGIKTLHLRMQRACENAQALADFLVNHPRTNRVIYPGLANHPQHELAKSQMSGFGAMVSFDLTDDSLEAAHKLLSNTHLFALAESLGGVESLIGHPASMTHASIPREERLKVGLTESLIRLSIGIEDVDDLIADLEMALE
jgi:cystathionine gamma-lyase